MSLVQVRGLGKRYTSDGPPAVDQLSFEIQAGEVLGLLGPNGAGKTTTIAMLSTLVAPDAGDALIGGHSIRRETMTVRRLINVVPQEIALYEALSARENLRFWGELRGVPPAQLRHQIDAYLAHTGLTERADARVSTFSGGMKRRLNLAVGLLGDPRLVLMDEPTVGIDPQSRRYILDWVKQLNRHGVSVLYTTHYMEEAQQVCHRIGVMDHGRLIALGTLKELTGLLGDYKTLRLQLSAGQADLALVEALQTIEGVQQVSATDQHVTLNARSTQQLVPALMATVEGLGLDVRAVEIQEPNLEAVFLHLTGRALRD